VSALNDNFGMIGKLIIGIFAANWIIFARTSRSLQPADALLNLQSAVG
jgi:hypothetical protein